MFLHQSVDFFLPHCGGLANGRALMRASRALLLYRRHLK
jgi:hypothetical protein